LTAERKIGNKINFLRRLKKFGSVKYRICLTRTGKELAFLCLEGT